MIAHRNWAPPYGGGTHTSLPLPGRDLLVVADEATADDLDDGLKYIWVFNIADPANPISISTFPTPAEQAYGTKGGHFGPHNLHENRPGSFVSDELIFATYQNAGLRVFDLANPYRPEEVGYFVPPPPARWMDPRPAITRILHSCDVGLISAQYQG